MVDTRRFQTQLWDARYDRNVVTAGGSVVVYNQGTGTKSTLYDWSGSSMSNPFVMGTDTPNGILEFAVVDTVLDVDVYLFTPHKQFLVIPAMKTRRKNFIPYDPEKLMNAIIAPFDCAVGAAAETDTGIDVPSGLKLGKSPWINVTTIDDTETIDLGFATGETGGDPNGLIAGASLDTLGVVRVSASTRGALLGSALSDTDIDTTPTETEVQALLDKVEEMYTDALYVTDGAPESIVYDASAGSSTGAGYFVQPYEIQAGWNNAL